MATRAEIYWEGLLMPPLGLRTERERRSARLRVCAVCDERVFLDDPTRVGTSRLQVGHDSDCEALAMFLEDIGSGGGGGGGGVPGGPLFASSDPVFSSTDPIFGDS
jgi:hypothetical protein